MKLNETITKTLDEILKECELIEIKYHTNDNADICAIECKYQPKKEPKDKITERELKY